MLIVNYFVLMSILNCDVWQGGFSDTAESDGIL